MIDREQRQADNEGEHRRMGRRQVRGGAVDKKRLDLRLDDQQRRAVDETGEDRMRRELDNARDAENSEKNLPKPGQENAKRRGGNDQCRLTGK